MVREIIAATTSKDKETVTDTKEIDPKTISKETWLPPGTHQMPASNVEKRDIVIDLTNEDSSSDDEEL